MTALTKRWFVTCGVLLLAPAPVMAQARPVSESTVPPASAGATAVGDSGLWYVASADVLPSDGWRVGFSASSETRNRGAIKPNYGALSAARGFGGRTEIFGTWQVTTEVDGRRGRGDMLLGAKQNLLSEQRGAPFGLAARAVLKVPTGNDELGASSGRADVLTEIVASRRFGRAEVTGSTGLILRGNPRGVNQPNGIRNGAGVAVMAHESVRVYAELHGEAYREGARPARLVSPLDTPTTASAGISWLIADRFAAGVGINRALGSRDEVRGTGVGVHVGYTPVRRRPVAATVAPATAGASVVLSTPLPPPPATRPSAARDSGASGPGAAGLNLDDVHFDLDKHTLRPDALAILDRTATAMRQDPTLRLQLDGHTCEIGTAEYNLALGARRAAAVRDYLVSRGISANRLRTTSYGQERPKHDMHTEDTRQLNRRVELRPAGN